MNRRWWALAALALAMLTIGLDITVLTVAVPTLATALHASTSQLQWFSTAYTLVMAAALLPAGMLGDRFGRRRMLVGALLLFGAASVACAYSGSAGALIGARAVLGLGAALMMPLSMAVLPVLFPDPTERARALAVWVTSTAIGLPLGPIVGGWLLDHVWWGGVFLINVPLVLVGSVAVALLVPESRSPRREPLDLLGVALSSAGLLGLTYGFIAAGQDGWADPAALVTLTAGVLLLAAFGWWQRRTQHPLVDVGLFRDAHFTAGTSLATLATLAMFGLMFALPQYFQAVVGADALGTGLRLLPLIAGLLVGSRLTGPVVALGGRVTVIGLGFGLLVVALGIGATTTVDTGFVTVAGWLTLAGAGLGLVLPTAMDAAIGALPADNAGAGSALIQAMRQVGGTIGVAVLGTVLNGEYRAALPADTPPAARDSAAAGIQVAAELGRPSVAAVRAAYVHSMDVTLVVSAGIAALGLVLAVVLLRRGRRSSTIGA